MVAIFRQTLTNLGTLDKLLYLVSSEFYLGLAKSTAWDNSWGTGIDDTNPPFPESNTNVIADILLYKKPIYKTLAVDSQCFQIEFDNCGESINTVNKVTLINLETTSIETLKLLTPKYIYLKVDITPSDISLLGNNSSFRIASLYKDSLFNNPTAITHLPATLVDQGIPYWITYFTPINTSLFADNKTSTFEILLKV